MHLMFQGGSPYLPEPQLKDQLYIQRFGADVPLLMAPMSCATPMAWNNEGSRICVLETRLGHLADDTGMADYLLWEYEVVLGRRRLVSGFPASARLDFTQVCYSSDDSWRVIQESEMLCGLYLPPTACRHKRMACSRKD
jgi:hypothetical protein